MAGVPAAEKDASEKDASEKETLTGAPVTKEDAAEVETGSEPGTKEVMEFDDRSSDDLPKQNKAGHS